MLAAAERAARAAAPGAIAAHRRRRRATPPARCSCSPRRPTTTASRRTAEAIARELQATLHGFTFAVGYSRVAADPVDLYRAGNEALLAANVAEGRPAGDGATPRPRRCSPSRPPAPTGSCCPR